MGFSVRLMIALHPKSLKAGSAEVTLTLSKFLSLDSFQDTKVKAEKSGKDKKIPTESSKLKLPLAVKL